MHRLSSRSTLFPYTTLFRSNERKKNLVVRLRGTAKHRPVLLIGHLDVVEARREDWSTDPFKLIEKDGYFYGRGTQRSEEHTSELQSHSDLVCRLLLEKKKQT